MPIDITIQQYLKDYLHLPLIDVRSPGEFEKGHIPGAYNIELFSNEERAHVGTIYKQQSQEKAIQLGYEYVTPKLDAYIERASKLATDKNVVVHCWRGGMRSHAFAQHLKDNGFDKVFVISKGYKAFRHVALNSFENYKVRILGGFTGSGKTHILKEIEQLGHQVLDLEGLASHKGSAFGSIGDGHQPSTEQFENNIYWEWRKFNPDKEIWIEDESPNIGGVNIPFNLFTIMRNTRLFFIDIRKEARAELLVDDYDTKDKAKLSASILKISKRLGHKATQDALNHLENNEFYEVAILALSYYDKYYLKGMQRRDQSKINILKLDTTDYRTNAEQIIKHSLLKEYA